MVDRQVAAADGHFANLRKRIDISLEAHLEVRDTCRGWYSLPMGLRDRYDGGNQWSTRSLQRSAEVSDWVEVFQVSTACRFVMKDPEATMLRGHQAVLYIYIIIYYRR